jgi:hypothetical protein
MCGKNRTKNTRKFTNLVNCWQRHVQVNTSRKHKILFPFRGNSFRIVYCWQRHVWLNKTTGTHFYVSTAMLITQTRPIVTLWHCACLDSQLLSYDLWVTNCTSEWKETATVSFVAVGLQDPQKERRLLTAGAQCRVDNPRSLQYEPLVSSARQKYVNGRITYRSCLYGMKCGTCTKFLGNSASWSKAVSGDLFVHRAACLNHKWNWRPSLTHFLMLTSWYLPLGEGLKW